MIAIRLLILSFLIPSEFNFEFGSLVLSAYRLILICLTPYVIWLFIGRSRNINWSTCDTLALAVGIWPIIAFIINTGFGAALESGGILSLELILPYFLVRLNVNTHETRKEFAHILFLMVTVLFFLGLPESILGRHFTHEVAGALTGSGYVGIPEARFGIWRTLGPTDHAIIFGTLCAITMSVAIVMAKRRSKYWFFAFFAGSGAIMSASSAPILAVIVQLGMLTWAKLTRGYQNRWWILLGLFIAFYIVVDILSNRDPMRVMFTYLLLNPETGYARYYMWVNSFEVAAQSIAGQLFGYGYDTGIFAVIENLYWRTLLETTVDSFWLVLMLRFGIIILLLYSIFVALVFARSLKYIFDSRRRGQREREFMQAWFITAFTMTLIATTVHFWGYMACMYMMILAVGVDTSRPHSTNSRQRINKTRRQPFQKHSLNSMKQ